MHLLLLAERGMEPSAPASATLAQAATASNPDLINSAPHELVDDVLPAPMDASVIAADSAGYTCARDEALRNMVISFGGFKMVQSDPDGAHAGQ